MKHPKEYQPYPLPYGFSGDWISAYVGAKAVAENLPCYVASRRGSLVTGKTFDKACEDVASKGFTLILKRMPSSKKDGYAVYWENFGYVEISYVHKTSSMEIEYSLLDEKLVNEIEAVCRAYIGKPKISGKAFVVAQGEEGPYLHGVGMAGETLIESNYTPEVIEDFKYIIESIKAAKPRGRLAILNGPPGTGKTHGLRAIMGLTPDITYILVPSNMASALASPQFVTVLLDQGNGRICLILEDADECLAKRDSGNVSEVSAVLNFGDGLLGEMIDLFIIASTNAEVSDFDPATMRPGRLCRSVNIGHLDHSQAEAVYKRCGGEKEGLFTDGNFYTLAEAYALANGSLPDYEVKTPKKKMGFSST